ncbi:hypothetical protein ABZY05_39555 [Streptomyces canus]|uniref:hypothetical protein n=1 Tax=Streptomyces canus TaxID=58343 RepID=UPI0033B56393
MPLRRRIATFALSVSLLTGAAVALAPSASAVGSSACTVNFPDDNGTVSTNGVNYRSGPGTSYSSKGLVYKGDRVREYCLTSRGGKLWYYTKLLKKSQGGLPAGTYGWLRADMFTQD